MNNAGLQALIFGDSARIVEAISTGAGWEIWMQVELALILRAGGLQAAREIPYPPPNGGLRLDVLAQDNAGAYAIEMKVESATKAGAAIVNAINADRIKIANYPQPNPGARWVVGIGYSNVAVQALAAFVNSPANNAIGAYANGIAVVIATV
jgi:hypothetical protein